VVRAVAACEYEGVARSLVLELKLGARRGAAAPLVEAMCRAARGAGVVGSLVTWVPGRRSEVRLRGYDHARLLAEGVAAALGLPAERLLDRVRPVEDQSTLGAVDRRRNLRGAFEARRSLAPVVLVDDLVTTGATATACARALGRAGAPTVELLTACRKS
jgi:predicted amidophosphoribosyltransferase